MIKRQKKPMRNLGRLENWKEGSCRYYRRGGNGQSGISRNTGRDRIYRAWDGARLWIIMLEFRSLKEVRLSRLWDLLWVQ